MVFKNHIGQKIRCYWTWHRTSLINTGKSRRADIVSQTLRSSHATHLLMLVIICIKYRKNPSRTVDATERTWFSRPRSNDLEDIGQGQNSLYATHPLILMIICAKHGKNPLRTVDFFFKVKAKKFKKFAQNSNLQILKKTQHATHPLIIEIICAKYQKNPSSTVDATEWTRFSKSRSNDLEDIGQGQRSSHATHLLMLVIICIKYGKNQSKTVDATERTRFSRPRPNDLEDIGQGQRSLYATHLLLLVIICARYGKNQLRTEDFFFQGQGQKICQKIQIFWFWKKRNMRHTLYW